jgi:AmmeMemoRadiSam system protein A
MKKQLLVLFCMFVFLIEEGFIMSDKNEPIVGLNKDEKIYLLDLARKTITELISHNKLPVTKPISDKVKEEFGVFVTLHKNGNLRGCIGYIEGIRPLYQAVMEMAESAAFRDPRFPPVQLKELDDLEIEISVLSPVVKIEDINRIEVGKHGIIIQRGPYQRGLLLPQVATEWGWNREEFLTQTCYKAGLPGDAWKDKETEISIFSAEIFNEKELHLHQKKAGSYQEE